MVGSDRSVRRLVAAAVLVASAPAAALVALGGDPHGPPPARAEVSSVPAAVPMPRWSAGLAGAPAEAPWAETAGAAADVTPSASLAAVAPVQPATPPPSPGSTFAERFPAQAMAVQDPADPATMHWALLIGINEHMGSVTDNIGSRQDAEDLRAHLLASGWRDDHILLLTDRAATRTNIVDGLRWLAERSDAASTVVFHYSGHSKQWEGEDVDGDGEVTDEGLWPTDDRFIVDSELVALLDPIDARRSWFSFATCNAAGFADHGLLRPGRVVTFSSGEPQKSYEHPAWGNSVWGFLMIDEAMRAQKGDLDGDGRVAVEEAWSWARPHASRTTEGQRDGRQDAVIVDQLDGDLHLEVPGAPRPRPVSDGDRTASPSQTATAPRSQEPVPAPRPTSPPQREETQRHGAHLCLLCG